MFLRNGSYYKESQLSQQFTFDDFDSYFQVSQVLY